ncbi:hypothetical protein [Nonomuraea jabiensis]|uniref:hypothetical protein n=1 Tax=Nonomuraea jabiensis TaxID=882448 RepID=UPI003676CEF3
MTTTVTPARRGGSRRRYVGLSAAVAGAAAAATAAVVVLTGLTGSPAYAVTKGADGAVDVQINAFTDPDGLEAELAKAGVRAVVDYLPEGQTCKEPRGAQGGGTGRFSASVGQSGGVLSFKIEEGQVPADATLAIAVSKSKAGADRPPFGMSLTVVKGPVAPCEPTAMPEPGAQDGKAGSDGRGLHTETGDKGQGLSNDSATG